MSGSSSGPTSQPADRTRPASSPAAAGDASFGKGTSVNFEGIGSPSSEAEAARAAAAFRQRSSLFHNGEGVATALIPDLTIALGTMALPFGPSIAAQMAPRFAQRLLPRLVLPEYNRRTSGVLLTNEGRVVRFRSGAPTPEYRNYASAKHAEGKAAIWLRENNSSGGVLFHNHPGGTCGFCDLQARTLLPEGVSLRIVPPATAVAAKDLAQTEIIPYVGNSKVPKLPRSTK
jgi:SCP1.201-like deaminase